MKKFILSIFCVTVFCVGLGALVDKAGAKFKSDERALALIKQARLAIGGDQSIADVRSMIIKGNTNINIKFNDTTKTEQGETEIAMQLPDKLSKMVKIGHGEPGDAAIARSEKHDVMILRKAGEGQGEGVGAGAGKGERVILRKVEGAEPDKEIELVVTTDKDGELKNTDGKQLRVMRRTDGPVVVEDGVRAGGKGDVMFERGEGHRQNEMLRMTLSLLLTAPEGMDVNYTFGGEGDVEGTPCNIVNAEFAGSSFKLFLSKASSLPVALSYLGHAAPQIMMFKTKEPEAGVPADKVVTFTRKLDAPEMTEVQVRFGDYRGTNGVQLPYKWTTVTGGQTSEVFDVTSYEINPANIADKFKNEKVMWRTTKDVN